MKNFPKEFDVDCVAEIDSFIGPAKADIIAYSRDQFEIIRIHNKYGSELSGENISDRLFKEIEEEVLFAIENRW